ncbi:MAG: hypothetical protein A2176_09440 [Spirochaetes bacterium RBG_13_51_14]|nr:MAG: hypothetical protein A2176_09440 [Spirochaetes bacterium RBG_13_51_14]
MPDPVPYAYLVEKTAEQGSALEKQENSIIAKNQENRKLKDKVKDADYKLKVDTGRLDILKEEKKLLEEKQKQYQLENDSERINENAKQISDKEGEIQMQSARVEYYSAVLEHVKTQNEVAEAELSVLVAELNYQKSTIAKEYLMKRKGAVTASDEKKGSTLPDPEKYEDKYQKYLDRQREILVAKKQARDEAAMKVKIAEEKLKK